MSDKLYAVYIDDTASDTEIAPTRVSALLTFLDVGQHYERELEDIYHIELPPLLSKIVDAGGWITFEWNGLYVTTEED
ncbi:MAG TPA: hypothetical protein VFK94_06650 [Patescibacteria group bacterium]|nr:hypothetical protein [Patescibacteria group bacterium]